MQLKEISIFYNLFGLCHHRWNTILKLPKFNQFLYYFSIFSPKRKIWKFQYMYHISNNIEWNSTSSRAKRVKCKSLKMRKWKNDIMRNFWILNFIELLNMMFIWSCVWETMSQFSAFGLFHILGLGLSQNSNSFETFGFSLFF